MQPPETDQQPDEMLSSPESPPLEPEPAEADQRYQDCLDALRRTQADFINYKRRMAQEEAAVHLAARTELLETLLPVLDDLGRALESAPVALAEQPWVQGIHLVARRLNQTLQQLGVHPVGSPGEPFDPYWHEAMMTEPRSDLPEGTVLQVTRPGYALGENVLRPAQVIVTAAPEATTVAPSES